MKVMELTGGSANLRKAMDLAYGYYCLCCCYVKRYGTNVTRNATNVLEQIYKLWLHGNRRFSTVVTASSYHIMASVERLISTTAHIFCPPFLLIPTVFSSKV